MDVYEKLTHPVAFTVFILSLLLPVVVGFLTLRRTKSQTDFFLGGRAMDKFIVALSAVSSGRSGWLVLGVSGMAYTRGGVRCRGKVMEQKRAMSQYTRDEILRKVKNRESLERADLRGIDLEGANLEGISFIFANLQEANLRGANLRNANLRGATLVGGDLRDADLEGATLVGADLTDTNLTGARMPNR